MRFEGRERKATSLLRQAIRHNGATLFAVAVFSGVINLLALTGAFYMLQVYDRVLPSGSLATLVGLTILLCALYFINGVLDVVRVRLMARVGVRIDNEMRDRVFAALQAVPLRGRPMLDGLQPVRDLDQIRNFLSGMGPAAVFDLPWIPLYLGIIFILHPLLGVFATASALLLIFVTALTEWRTQRPVQSASRSGGRRMAFAEDVRRNAEAVHALGMHQRMQQRWEKMNSTHVADQLRASDAAAGLGSASKVLRLFLQSGILGLGAWLVIEGQLSAGAIIASSIVMSRALAPIETAIAHWRGFVSARQARDRLDDLFNGLALHRTGSRVQLPEPRHSLMVSGLFIAPPGTTRNILQNVSFSLRSGDGLGIIGPSGAGKSTLARAIAGIWQPDVFGGTVRLDGAAIDQWDDDDLGRHLGYLPQNVALMPGTVAENIARFDPAASSEAVIAAAQAAGAHDMIVQLPAGYETPIEDAGQGLSAGQAQRVALARALYGDPFLVVLDEPNSNLDEAGELALTRAIAGIRARGGIVVAIAHRPSALAAVDKVLVLAKGSVVAFGPKAEVLKQVLQPPAGPEPPPAAPNVATALPPGLRIVADTEAKL
ncbi:MAG: type I secretion system permease/ATPase [Hyphomicrobium sp.]|nr:type I secretion system permease/ATPase [Hyphomicrobium sp.]